MQVYLTLVRREIGYYFVSFTGYLVMAVVLLLLGLSFSYLLQTLNTKPSDQPISELFYETLFFWFILLLTAPVITMRAFAQEKNSGTFENLMTTPVSDWQVVLAKFSGAMVFYLLLWLPLLGCILVLQRYAPDPAGLDYGVLASTFLGIGLVGGLYMSLGCFTSALTHSQIVAAISSFALGIAMFFMSFFTFIVPPQASWHAQVMQHISLFEHMQDFVRGIVDTRHMVFYLSLTAGFLYLTLKVIESRRWK